MITAKYLPSVHLPRISRSADGRRGRSDSSSSSRGGSQHRRSLSSSSNSGGTSSPGKAALRHQTHRAIKQEKELRRHQERQEVEERWRREEEQAKKEEDRETRQRYGVLTHPDELISVSDIADLPVGTDVTFRARIHHQRPLSKMLTFILFRTQTDSIQGVLANASPHMLRWTERLHHESLVHVTGRLKKPDEPIKSASISDVEVDIYSIHLVNAANDLPWDNYEPPEALSTRMSARVLDLRHPSNQALFRIRSMVLQQFRKVLEDNCFMEIQTPKLQPSASEGGAAVFQVNYFGRKAFLAQSPQLAKQMAISADMKRVFEVGPVFRAENSNTHRHLTEYTGLDIEMAIQNSYYETINILDQFLKAVFSALHSAPELEVVRQRWPSQDLVWLEETPVLPFTEGVQMLRDDGRDVEIDDLSTRDEIRLGELVKEKYKTDYYILDKFPVKARPFYTAKAEDPQWTNSFDMFIRGQEICSGGQRIHDPKKLRENMRASKVPEVGKEDYLAGFDWGAPPHAGAGLGLERILTFMLELGDIRNASLFPRDPKSLPEPPPTLPHPEADTTKPEASTNQPALEKLIANYGDASNTSWLDERYQIWRHSTGAAVGYAFHNSKYAIITGDPLCDPSQFSTVISAFLDFVNRELHRTPVWILVSDQVQQILAQNHKWRTLTCVEEQRVDVDHHEEPGRKSVRRVEREGIEISEVEPDEDFQRRADKGIEAWKAARVGKKQKQVRLTDIRPWVDIEHRRYFAAQKNGEILCLVVLHQLAPKKGWQIKWALDFPSAPNGAIEVLIETALTSVPGPFTFGAGVSESLTPGAHMGNLRSKLLSDTYEMVIKGLRLRSKSSFREKFGVIGEQVYICFPRHGIGLRDLHAIVNFFQN